MRVGLTVFALCLLLFVGCGRQPERAVVTTNVVERVREVVVTNVVNVTREVVVTNVVVERRERERVLSARRTAPYAVSAPALGAPQLRRLLSDAGARVIACEAGSVAVVEASDGTAAALRPVATVKALEAEDKIAADAGTCVRVLPISTIDAGAVAEAVRKLGGELVQVVTVGRPCVRAKMSFSGIRKLAARGDVRRIERDEK